MGITEELKKTNKGKLQYSRDLDAGVVQKLIEEVSVPPKLYLYHKKSVTKPEKKVVQSLQPSPEEKSDKSKDEREPFAKSSQSMPSVLNKLEINPIEEDVKVIPVQRSAPVSPEYGRTCLQIRNYEVLWDNKAKSSIEAKIQEFEKNDEALQAMVKRKACQLEHQQLQEMKKLMEQTSKLHLQEKAETSKRVQQMKDSHLTRKKLQDDRLKEGERKAQQLQEEERKRQEREKLQMTAQQRFVDIRELHDLAMSTVNKYKLEKPLAETFTQVLSKAQTVLKKPDLTTKDIQTLDDLIAYTKNSLEFIKAKIAADIKKAEADAIKQKEQAAAATTAAAVTATTTPQPQEPLPPMEGGPGVNVKKPVSESQRPGVIDEVVTQYEMFKAKLEETKKYLASFLSDTQTKKYRFELQKAVNTPINAISPVDGSNLRDKLQKLIHVLGGHQIEGKHVSAKDVPQGITFCKNLIAKMFVKKGEEQVSSKHESAFAIAMVAAGLWHEHNDLGELMLAHFHDFCPYIVPIYLPRDSSMTTQEYHRLLGYRIEEDGSIEPQDKFLKRMSGIMRLYAAILISSPPRANCVHPHGVEHAWIWFARIMNMDPQPDITATMTFDMLQVTGHALYTAYKIQFIKLLYLLFKGFLPKLKSVSVASGPVTRLEIFIQQTMQNFAMKKLPQPPEGYLPQNFWFKN